MTAVLIGLGCQTPSASVDQRDAARFCISRAGLTGDAARFAEVVHQRSGIERRGTVLVSRSDGDGGEPAQGFFERSRGADDLGPTTAARMRAYAELAPALAVSAAAQATADASRVDERVGSKGAAITHLVTVSCTGFAAPGVDVALMAALGLSPDVQRTHVGFMGCHGAIVGLRLARALAEAVGPDARVLLVCVELCSLHFQYSARPDQSVANALFADGAAAAVVANARGLPREVDRLLEVCTGAGRVFPDCADAMGWIIGDHGFEMRLAESVPELLRGTIGPWVEDWLGVAGMEMNVARTNLDWAVHPGGPRVLSAVAEGLGLSDGSIAASRSVLREHGNMSSPTVLFILERLMRSTQSASRRGVVMLGFGPGLSAEGILLERRGR